jgi:putative endonuclease
MLMFHQPENYRPWKLMSFIAFGDATKAEAFEKYLKSGSGRAFTDRRLW